MKADSANKLVKISSVIKEIYGDDLHKKRQLSIAHATMGLLSSESLFLHRMAEVWWIHEGGNKKHAAKQIDRLLSNKGLSSYTTILFLNLTRLKNFTAVYGLNLFILDHFSWNSPFSCFFRLICIGKSSSFWAHLALEETCC